MSAVFSTSINSLFSFVPLYCTMPTGLYYPQTQADMNTTVPIPITTHFSLLLSTLRLLSSE